MAEVTEQIVREAPEIEAYKLGLLKSAQALPMPTLPDYQVAGMSQDQLNAMATGRAGIGDFQPFLNAGSQAVTAGQAAMGEAGDILRGADTRGQFGAAQQAYDQSSAAAARMGDLSNVAGSGMGYIGQGNQALVNAQDMARQSSQADLGASQGMMLQSVGQAQQAINQPGFGQAENTLQSGIGALEGAAQGFDPSSAQAFMNPYQQQVIDESMRQIDRQGAIQQQGLNAQAVRAGAFGGSREGIQRQELNRNLAETKNAAITNALQQGYGMSMQQAQQAFEQQQQRQLAQAQGLQGAAGQAGALASQQAGLGMQSAQYAGNVGQNLGAQNLQQASLGQQGAQNLGQLGSTQANLAGQTSNVAAQQSGILGQQAQIQQNLGQGIGNLANQEFGIGQGMATGIGALGTQTGNLGVQQAALGAQQQALGQGDTNFLYNMGATQQRQSQAELDALRASQTQTALAPQQQLAFVSDIYKGAPSTQMAVTQQQAPAASTFQQITGLGTGVAASLAAAKSGGII
jgi:hypothetical protein